MTGRRLLSLAGLLAALAACTVPPPAPASRVANVASVAFEPTIRPRGVARANAELAEDFLDLTFALESGQTLPGLLRHEGPIRVAMRTPGLRGYDHDLDSVLTRMRREAGIDIARTADVRTADIVIDGVTSQQIQQAYPGAACFIVPGETGWDSFRRKSRRQRLRWSDQGELGRTAIFVPTDSTPQDIRDCLNEELAQALGPANDIYRLADSVYNDDNFHSVLTPFDMLVLRVLYSPELHSGMSRGAVAQVLPGVLDRLNPAGRHLAPRPRAPETPEWKEAIEQAMTRSNSLFQRRRGAERAVALAAAMQPRDHRLGVALLARGRLNLRSSPASAAKDFANAYSVFLSRLGPDDVRTAQAALHVAIVALRDGDRKMALRLADQSVDAALAGENAVLASGLLAIHGEALAGLGRAAEAKTARVDSLKWARYAFGDADGAMAAAQAELEMLGPSPREENPG